MTLSVSSSWPWMKGVSVSIADPIDPVCPEDVRPSVKALIEEHTDKIGKIKAAIQDDPLYNASKHDDLWILRFWLSHKKSKNAIAAAKETLQFRAKYQLDETDIRSDPPHRCPEPRVAAYWKKRCQGDAIICSLPDPQRGVVMFLTFAKMNPNAITTVSKEEWHYAFVYSSEWSFQHLDYVTRTTGRLTKSVRLIELANISLLRDFDRKTNQRDGVVMNEMEDVYPQLLETLYACNPPSWIHIVWAMVRPIMPKRILDKVDMITPLSNEKERKGLWKHISKEKLPAKYGGENAIDPAEW